MSREFHKYKDIRKLNKCSIGKDGKDIFAGTIITATSDMAKAMYQYYGPIVTYGENPDTDIDVRVISSAIKGLVSEWETDIRDIKNYIVLRNVIDVIYKSDKIKYLKRNAYEIWNAIKILVEMGVYWRDIPDGVSEHIDDLKKIFKELTDDKDSAFYNPRVKKFYDEIDESYNKEIIKEIINKKLNENNDEVYQDLKDDIYLFGFYFVTALQERVFDILDKAGYNLHFMLCYNDEYPYPNEVWKNTLDVYFKDIDKVEAVDDKVSSLANNYGDFLNGNIIESLPVKLYKHNSDIDFVKYVEDAQNNVETVFSPNVRACEELIRGYHPEYVQKKKLLAYPIGQYLYNLHSCIDTSSDKASMDVSYNNVLRCFASGCLNATYKTLDKKGKIRTEIINGKDFLYEMSVLKPFFSRCHTFSDWYRIFDSLCDSIRLKEFFDPDEECTNKAYESLKNPFNYIAALKIPVETLKKIATLIDLIREDLSLLIEGKKEDENNLEGEKEGEKNRTLGDYYDALKIVIDRRKTNLCKPLANANEGQSEKEQPDEEIRNFIIDGLMDEEAYKIPCHLDSIKDAIIFFLSEKNAEYESFEAQNVYSRGRIKPLTLVETEMLNNYGQTVHLVWADEYSLPGSPTKLPWPLTMELFEEIKGKLFKKHSDLSGRQIKYKYIDTALNVIKNRPLANRYLFYTFLGLSNEDNNIELSVEWLSDDGTKEIAVSPYVSMLDLKIEANNCNTENNDLDNHQDDEEKQEDKALTIDQTAAPADEHEENPVVKDAKREEILAAKAPELAIMDYDLCPYRYTLSYENNDGPSYMTDFHYSFLIGKLTAALFLKTGCEKKDIVDTISRIFAYKSEAEIDDAKKFTPGIIDTINNHFRDKNDDSVDIWNMQIREEKILKEEPEYALLPHYLDYDIMKWVVESRIEEVIEKHNLGKHEASELKLNTDGLKVQKCKYCPYGNVCINRYYKYPANNPNMENEYAEEDAVVNTTNNTNTKENNNNN